MAIKDSILTNGTSSHAIQTTLNYWLEPATGDPKVFYPGPITDVRGHEKEFSLDKQGFTYVKHQSEEKEYADQEGIKDRFYPEIGELVKEVTGASYVRPFSHVVRRERWEDAQSAWEGKRDDEVIRKKIPARFAHVDHSYVGAEQILRDNFPDEEERERLSKTRWGSSTCGTRTKSIHHDVTRDPLAVCDARTVEESDLVGVTAVVPTPRTNTQQNVTAGKDFETWHIRANAAHRWYYKSHMTPDDALLLKIFDSKKDGRARRTPHTSFKSSEDYGETRMSVEVRCFVFWEDQSLE